MALQQAYNRFASTQLGRGILFLVLWTFIAGVAAGVLLDQVLR